MNLNDMLVVGMADLNCLRHPGVITTLGLGSCVGIALFDQSTKVIGMAHCMLPDSTQITNNANKAKFVDTATVKLIGDMLKLGARRELIRAKIAGGAQMFAFTAVNESMRIGDRNVEAARLALSRLKIPIVASETGENYGRTIELYSDDFKLVVKTIGHGTRVL